jgi:uncharacterized protein
MCIVSVTTMHGDVKKFCSSFSENYDSGHGVCGLGRLSPRSIVNVVAFLATGVLLASFIFTSSAELGVAATTVPADGGEFAWQALLLFIVPAILIAIAVRFNVPRLSHLTLGAVFGAGLAVSGMTESSKVIGFLNVRSGHWDPSLMCVLGGAVIVSFCAYRAKAALKLTAPRFDVKFFVPTNTKIEWRLVVGGILFGLGWATGGFCPGPVVANLFQIGFVAPTWLACMLIGGIVVDVIERQFTKNRLGSVAEKTSFRPSIQEGDFEI